MIVRTDIPLGRQAAMLIHAAGESAKNLKPGTYAIALAAPNEKSLLLLERTLATAKVAHAAFREPDYGDQLMAIGIEPVQQRRTVRRYLKGFNLFGGYHGMR